MKKPKISSLSPMKFTKIGAVRDAMIASSPADPLPHQDSYLANKIAKALHPDNQSLIITKVEEFSQDVKRYTLSANSAKGTEKLAYFSAGQYLSITLNIGEAILTRPYSISSSPSDALNGFYQITVKRVANGLATNYILDTWKVGDEVNTSAPLGEFSYEPLRDAENVIGLAGGSGITPFLSLARAIECGDEVLSLTLLYGSRTKSDILFKDEFDRIANSSDRFNVVYVLSDEKDSEYENGFLTAELIKRYAPSDKPYSIFMCGPQGMYEYADSQIEQLGIRRKFVRRELFGEYHNPQKDTDYNKPDCETVKISVIARDKKYEIEASCNDTILQSVEKHGIYLPSHCRSGECGWCHSRLVSGSVYIPKSVDGRRLADKDYGYIHPCCTFPLTDVEIVIYPEK